MEIVVHPPVIENLGSAPAGALPLVANNGTFQKVPTQFRDFIDKAPRG